MSAVKLEPMEGMNEECSSISSHVGQKEAPNWNHVEQYSVIKFLTKEGSSPDEIFERLQKIYLEKVLPEVQVYYAAGRFAEGRESIHNIQEVYKSVKTSYNEPKSSNFDPETSNFDQPNFEDVSSTYQRGTTMEIIHVRPEQEQEPEPEIDIMTNQDPMIEFHDEQEVDFPRTVENPSQDLSCAINSLFEFQPNLTLRQHHDEPSTSSQVRTSYGHKGSWNMGRQLHWSWRYFEQKLTIVNDKPTMASFCKFCNERYVNNATRMARHLLKKCKMMPKETANFIHAHYSHSYYYKKPTSIAIEQQALPDA